MKTSENFKKKQLVKAFKIFQTKKKNKKQEYVCKRYESLPERIKQRLVEKEYHYKTWKNQTASQTKSD